MRFVENHFSVAAGVLMLGLAACQTTESAPEGNGNEIYIGRNLYLGYCASCHGSEGAGDGPVQPFVKPPDLRTIRSRHGRFPREWLFEVIDGRTLRAAHGSADMPVWGWQFRLVEENQAAADARIEALVDYIERMQQSP